MPHQVEPLVIFITGTDTGVGKTVLTTLLLVHLRQIECPALALKPFCTGSRADAKILHSLQMPETVTENRQIILKKQLTLDEINPFYFRRPLAPLVAARELRHHQIPLSAVIGHIGKTANQLPPRSPLAPRRQAVGATLLIEGIGGLLVPLGPGYSVIDLIMELKCGVIVASCNRLGTINHTSLTVRSLQYVGIKQIKIVVMDSVSSKRATTDARSNPQVLAELLAPVPVFRIPYLGHKPLGINAIKENAKKLKKTLAQILE